MNVTTTPVAVTNLTYCRREHSKTLWIEGSHPEAERPDALLKSLVADGWIVDPVFDRIPAYPENYPNGPMVKDFCLTRPGTDLFGAQTDAEVRSIRRSTNRILANHGFANAPVWAKTLTDML